MNREEERKQDDLQPAFIYSFMNILSRDSNPGPDTSLGCRSFH